jgi:hypothetical protein
MRIRVASGKYTFAQVGTFIDITRYGEPWHKQEGAFNAITSMMYELDAARVVLEVTRSMGDDAPIEIKRALAQHDSLVSDREPPSEWTK